MISCPYTLTKDVLPANGIANKSILLNLTLFSYIRTNLTERLKDKLRLKLYKKIYFFLDGNVSQSLSPIRVQLFAPSVLILLKNNNTRKSIFSVIIRKECKPLFSV